MDCRGNLCQMLHKHYFSIETHPGKCEYELLHKVFPRDHSTFGFIAGGYLIFKFFLKSATFAIIEQNSIVQ